MHISVYTYIGVQRLQDMCMNVILRDKDRYLCQKVKGSPIHNMIMEHGRKSAFYKPIPLHTGPLTDQSDGNESTQYLCGIGFGVVGSSFLRQSN